MSEWLAPATVIPTLLANVRVCVISDCGFQDEGEDG